mmetsp:Transcript_4870/g.12137  ORF Transcript_4870/g.12137 Transcript_4870/m.12137 type:complete len:262 (-) Transcript_4870:177-962(-)|eukprot:CAMPEP_0177649440 /NCGR_PEP_ID=MMETSP0447-20121125/11388_1 /TAXON_ID=0 /ORGANISM="Stygamoeba regulata, Strain BSH-02190019" /LENGTH=261 /DNA_ID=CAMNT_0019152199 /DNA_START=98 /DNA_END=883 /DNA_ORIENTATION=+
MSRLPQSRIDPGKELGAIPFENIIGAPLLAVVHAMAKGSEDLIEFINEVGFDNSGFGNMAYMAPNMQGAGQAPATQTGGAQPAPTSGSSGGSMVPGGQGGGQFGGPGFGMLGMMGGGKKAKVVTFEYNYLNSDGTPGASRVVVPFLTMIPLPVLRVQELTLTFNAKITQTRSWSSSGQDIMTSDSESKGRSFWSGSKTKTTANFANMSTNEAGVTYGQEYSMKIKLKAVSDEQPGGIARLLDLLEGAITDGAAKAENGDGQ